MFDTLAFMKDLKNGGVPQCHAETHAKALNVVLHDFVTKEYLDYRLDLLEKKMTIKMGAMITANFTLTVMSMGLMFNFFH